MADPRLNWRGVNAPDFQGASQILNNAGSQWDRAFGGLADTIGDVRTRQKNTRSNEALPVLAKVAQESGVDSAIDAVTGMVGAKDRTDALNAAMANLRDSALGYEKSRAERRYTDAGTNLRGVQAGAASAASARQGEIHARNIARENQLAELGMLYATGDFGEGTPGAPGSVGSGAQPNYPEMGETSVEDRASGSVGPTAEAAAAGVDLSMVPRQAPAPGQAGQGPQPGRGAIGSLDGYVRPAIGDLIARAAGDGQNFITPEQVFGLIDRGRVDRDFERTETGRQTQSSGAAWADQVRRDLDPNDPIADAYSRIDSMDLSPAEKQTYREQTQSVLTASQAPLQQKAIDLAYQLGDIPLARAKQMIMNDPSIPGPEKQRMIQAYTEAREGLGDILEPVETSQNPDATAATRMLNEHMTSLLGSTPQYRFGSLMDNLANGVGYPVNQGAGTTSGRQDEAADDGTGTAGLRGTGSGGEGGSGGEDGPGRIPTAREVFEHYNGDDGKASFNGFQKTVRAKAAETGMPEGMVAELIFQNAMEGRNRVGRWFGADDRVNEEMVDNLFAPYVRGADGRPNPEGFQIRDEIVQANELRAQADTAMQELQQLGQEIAVEQRIEQSMGVKSPRLEALQTEQQNILRGLQQLSEQAAVMNGAPTSEERDEAQRAAEEIAQEASANATRDANTVAQQDGQKALERIFRQIDNLQNTDREGVRFAPDANRDVIDKLMEQALEIMGQQMN